MEYSFKRSANTVLSDVDEEDSEGHSASLLPRMLLSGSFDAYDKARGQERNGLIHRGVSLKQY